MLAAQLPNLSSLDRCQAHNVKLCWDTCRNRLNSLRLVRAELTGTPVPAAVQVCNQSPAVELLPALQHLHEVTARVLNPLLPDDDHHSVHFRCHSWLQPGQIPLGRAPIS